MGRTVTCTTYVNTEVDVEVDIEDVLDGLDDTDLSKCGLMRTSANPPPTEWNELSHAMRRGDRQRVDDLLADMAWRMGGVILPTGIPLVH